MSEWKEYKLGEISTFSQGIQVPVEEQQSIPFQGAVRFIRIVDFTNNDPKDIRYIADPGSKYIVEVDDLVMIRYGSQTAGKIVRGFRGVIANNTFKISPDEKLLSKDFLFYFLSQKTIYDYFKILQSSSTMPAITFGQIGDLKIKIPPLATQTAITKILASLDDKIELNNKINHELEALAHTLFKQWFVDFEFPNENGEPYKSSGGEMFESELGEIPKGWVVGALGDVIYKETLKVKKLSSTINKVYSAVKTSELILSEEYFNKQVYSKSIENYYVVRRNWFAYNPSRINIGSIGLNKTEIGAVSPVYIVFSTKNYFHFFIEYLVKLENIKNAIIQRCSGTVRQALNFEGLSSIPLKIPNSNLVKMFNDFVEHNTVNITEIKNETLELTNLRDSLLPKLISGELELTETPN